MRRLIALVSVVILVFTIAASGSAQTELQTKEPAAKQYWQLHGCKQGWRSVVAYNRIRLLLHNYNPDVRKARVRRYSTCLATRAKAHHAHQVARKWWAWRHTYGPLWSIRRNTIDGGLLSRLASIRWCESRGDYYIDTHHDGAYQYLPSTWQRAQAFYRAVTGKSVVGWRTYAYQASPAHQDVVTSVFYPAHIGEWDYRCRR